METLPRSGSRSLRSALRASLQKRLTIARFHGKTKDGIDQMHEATWLRLMRTGFILLCVLPTVFVIAWATYGQLPWRTLSWEDSLRKSLGLVVRIDRVTHPGPRQTRLHGVQLIDPETRRRVASTTQLDCLETSRGWQWHAAQVDVASDGVLDLWRLWHQGILQEDLLDGRDAQLLIDRVSFAREAASADSDDEPSATHSLTPGMAASTSHRPESNASTQWRHVRWTSDMQEAQRRSKLEFDWPTSGANGASDDTSSAHKSVSLEPPDTTTDEIAETTDNAKDGASQHDDRPAGIVVTVRRMPQEGQQQTVVTLDTGAQALPLAHLAEWMRTPIPSSVDLKGSLQLILGDLSWTAQFKGTLDQIELQAWTEERIPYPIAGTAQFDLRSCVFGSGGIQEAWGKLRIEQGSFDRRLFEALIRNRLANPGPALAATTDHPVLDDVNVQLTFVMNQFGFFTEGDKSSPDLIAKSEAGPLLVSRTDHKHLDALIRALVYPAAEASMEESQKLWRVAYQLKQWLPSLPLDRK